MLFQEGQTKDLLLVTGSPAVYERLISAFPEGAVLQYPLLLWAQKVLGGAPRQYGRYILVAEGTQRSERAEYTAVALELAERGYPVNVFAVKNRNTAAIQRKLSFTLSLPPIPPGAHGDGFKVLPGGFRTPVKRVTLSDATEKLMQAFQNYTPGKKLVIAIDTGGGKTTTLARAFQTLPLSPALFLSPTLKLAESFYEEFERANPGLGGLFRGRNPKLCHLTDDVQRLGQSRRSINANLCQSCIHGLETMISRGSKTAEAKKIALEEKGVDFTGAKECGYIVQMGEVRELDMLIAAEASLAGTPKHLLEQDLGSEDKTDRILIWDDCFTPFSEVTLSIEDLDKWVARADYAIKNVSAPDEQREWVARVFPLITTLHQAQKDSLATTRELPRPISDVPCPGFPTWNEAGVYLGTAPLEAKARDGVVVEEIRGVGDQREIPVRAVYDLGKALTLGSVWIDRGKLRFAIPTLSLDLFNSRGGIILDATPAPLVRELADEIVEIRIEQPNLYVEMDVSLFRGRAGLREATNAKKAAEYLEQLCLQVANTGVDPKDMAVITHKPIELSMDPGFWQKLGLASPKIGHWGAHERGHNDYKASTVLILDGVPVPPPDACFVAYETARFWLAAVRGVDEQGHYRGWAPYTAARRKIALSLPMRHGVASLKSYVSDNPDVARWLRESVTAALVQAIGRLRAVRREQEKLHIIICTSFPLSHSYGLEIHSIVGDRASWNLVTKLREQIRMNQAGPETEKAQPDERKAQVVFTREARKDPVWGGLGQEGACARIACGTARDFHVEMLLEC